MDLRGGAPDFWTDDEEVALTQSNREPGIFSRIFAVRELEPSMVRRVSFSVAATSAAGGVVAVVGTLVEKSVLFNWRGTLVIGLSGIVIAAFFALLPVASLDFMMRHMAPIDFALLFVAPTAVSVGLYFAGPRWLLLAGIYAPIIVFSFYAVSIGGGILQLFVIGVEFIPVLALRPGYGDPGLSWVFMMVVLGAVGAIIGLLVISLNESAEAERRTRSKLADLNSDLEFRIDEQVDELDRLGRLRRFLSPQVAEAIVDSRQSDLGTPHRKIIAVLFTDLRGFTAFSAHAEPEDVMEVLDSYYKRAGLLFAETGATIGGFAGDGVMSFFNDPVSHDDPAGAAVELGVRLRAAMAPDVDTWHRRGYQLGIGMGVAYGYATLGLIGCEGRLDYTALGPVVNLASRLCNAARHDEILIDERTLDAVEDRVEVESFELEVKGLDEPIRAQRVLAWHALHLAESQPA